MLLRLAQKTRKVYSIGMTKNVALAKCGEYDFEKVYAALKELTRLAPPPDPRGKTVLIKPNILYPRKPEDCVCTNPAVVGALVKIFVELGAKKVLAGESPAVANSTSAARASGILEQVEKNGGEWVDFHDKVQVECPGAKRARSFDFAKQILDTDILVSAAKLKSHQLMKYTGAMKNLFGLMIGLEKAQCHYRFSSQREFGEFLTDLNLAAKAQYAVMDAIVGMDGPGGPGSGDPIELGFMAASDNILALDWVCSSLVGYKPQTVENLRDALERKVWLDSAEQIKILGASFDECANKNFRIVKDGSADFSAMLPGWLDGLAKFVFTRTPRFRQSKCIKCGRCAQICPAHIVEMSGKDGKAVLTDWKKCLHCFCCHEICPQKAISLRRFIH